MVVGYAALVLLVRLVVRGHFAVFRWHVWAMALVAGAITWMACGPRSTGWAPHRVKWSHRVFWLWFRRP